MELLVLGSLHYLGCGWTFSAWEELTVIAGEVHCRFLNVLYGLDTMFFIIHG